MEKLIDVFKQHGIKIYVLLEVLLFAFTFILNFIVNKEIKMVMTFLAPSLIGAIVRIAYWTRFLKWYDEDNISIIKLILWLPLGLIVAFMPLVLRSIGIAQSNVIALTVCLINAIFILITTLMLWRKSNILMLASLLFGGVLLISEIMFFITPFTEGAQPSFMNILLNLTSVAGAIVALIPLAYYFVKEKF